MLTDLPSVREASTAEVLKAQMNALSGVRFGKGSMEDMGGFGPTLDPVHLPVDPVADDAAAGFAGKDLLIGWTLHEASILFAGDPEFNVDMTAEDARRKLDAIAPGRADALYRVAAETAQSRSPHLVYSRAASRELFELPAIDIAAQGR